MSDVTYQAFSNGQIQFQQMLTAVVGDKTISQPAMFVLTPDDDITNQPVEIQTICNMWWTPEHIAAWQTLIKDNAILNEDVVIPVEGA